jgi:integrase/recombinase XerD
MIATCKLILYHYQQKQFDAKRKYPIRLRVTFQRHSKYYSLRVSMTPASFNKILINSGSKEEFKHVSHFLIKAESIINDLREQFTWEEFEARFFVKAAPNHGIIDLYQSISEYAEMAKNEGRLKTSASYLSTLKKVQLLNKCKVLPFTYITKLWLSSFANALKEEGLKVATIGIYTRNLRSIYNWEISRGRVKPETYPFGRNKFKPPSSTRVKKALNYDDVVKILNYIPTTQTEFWARDMWLFSYLANGMNIKDVALLKYENISGNEIHFVRAKTKNKTIDNQRLVHVFLHPHMQEIIDRWGNKERKEEQFIFKIMDLKDHSPISEYRNINQAVKTINKYMKRIGTTLELSKLPTCNFARHTYSTVLKRAQVPIEVISESLGHFSVKTTEIYLDSFESDKRAEISKFLLPMSGVKQAESME